VQAGGLASLLGAPIAVAIGGGITVVWSVVTAVRMREIRDFDERRLDLGGGGPQPVASAVPTA